MIMEYIGDGTVYHLHDNLAPEHMNQATDTSIEMLRAFVGERLKHQVDQLEAILPELVDIKLVEELPKSLGFPDHARKG
ncbi:hypothetical protein COOONC_21942 [Cooperia oncophora]